MRGCQRGNGFVRATRGMISSKNRLLALGGESSNSRVGMRDSAAQDCRRCAESGLRRGEERTGWAAGSVPCGEGNGRRTFCSRAVGQKAVKTVLAGTTGTARLWAVWTERGGAEGKVRTSVGAGDGHVIACPFSLAKPSVERDPLRAGHMSA